ncbi:hypothetical protein [Methylobacterium sp. E-045]|uniref:hypothetical protein n=1 Tax=Methylobacterium sp. E-045 TaxID=2836575 RepID=UPI001FB99A0F|nr:hypothetical protein [Methylobacterium sp. E-045]MCJ2127370.1 hypothetical protein [Methylobacterium sp. E-045]
MERYVCDFGKKPGFSYEMSSRVLNPETGVPISRSGGRHDPLRPAAKRDNGAGAGERTSLKRAEDRTARRGLARHFGPGQVAVETAKAGAELVLRLHALLDGVPMPRNPEAVGLAEKVGDPLGLLAIRRHRVPIMADLSAHVFGLNA